MDVYTFTSKSYGFEAAINENPLTSGMNIGRVYHTMEYSNTPYLLSGHVSDGKFIYSGVLNSGVDYPCGHAGTLFPSGSLYEYGLIAYDSTVLKPSGIGYPIKDNYGHTTVAESGVIEIYDSFGVLPSDLNISLPKKCTDCG